jgi:hypothetical protein
MPRTITTKYPARCADCGTELAIGSEVRYYGYGRIYGMTCHAKGNEPNLLTTLENAAGAAERAYTAYVKEWYVEPAFAVVDNAPGDLFHNPGKPTKVVGTMFDVCGFVNVKVDNSRRNGAPGARLIKEFKVHGTTEGYNGDLKMGAFTLRKSSYYRDSGFWHLGGPTDGGTGNGALSAATAGGEAFVAAMTAAGYEGLRVESRID